MIKRELKVNFKGFCIWLISTMIMFLIVFLVYPSIIETAESDALNELLKSFPEDLLKSFNMDISSIDSAYGWLKSEGFVFILLIIGSYSAILGSNILLKEESDKTIEYLGVLPIKRKNIVLVKSLVGVIYIISFTILVSIFNYFGLYFSGDFEKKQYILLSLTPILSSITVFFLCMFLSTYTNKTKKMLGVSLGIVLVSYVLNAFSSLSDSTKFLKYFSVFTLSDIRNVILNVSIDIKIILISLLISIFFMTLTIIKYNNKEFV